MSEPEKRIAVIRTSDRSSFKGCRRKWNWSSHLRGNYEPKQNAAPLWFGTGFHFVMEDYHGYRRFKNPVDAFHAYVEATRAFDESSLPDDWKEHIPMGVAMIEYYLKWEARRKNVLFPTLWVKGVPQVEVNFRVDLPLDPEYVKACGYDAVVYSGTIDRVVYDPKYDLIWLLDWKSAKVFSTSHFPTDPQVTAYCWAGRHMYKREVAGMIYAQHKKLEIKPPKVLKNGTLSVAKNQNVTYITYRDALIGLYGSVKESPESSRAYLKTLASAEDASQDKFIRFDNIDRAPQTLDSEGYKILLEAIDMINPELPLYNNPSRDCGNFCSFNSLCVDVDDGSDWEAHLEGGYRSRSDSYDKWRDLIAWPDEQEPVEEVQELPDFDNL